MPGRGHKNAVDIRLTIDAVEYVYERPYVDTFILVSGDRDFIHLLKHLRKHDKRVIGVAPAVSASEDLAELCDRFVTYKDLWLTYNQKEEVEGTDKEIESLDVFKFRLRELLERNGGRNGIYGAKLKTLIRREISTKFDEASYGYPSFSNMMRALPEVIRIEQHDGPGDITMFLVEEVKGGANINESDSDRKENEIKDIVTQCRARLASTSIDWERPIRDGILNFLHGCFSVSEYITFNRIIEKCSDHELDTGEPIGAKRLQGYLTVFYQSKMFYVNQSDLQCNMFEKGLKLRPEYSSIEDFLSRFEVSIVYKILGFLPVEEKKKASCVRRLLQMDEEDDHEYVVEVIKDAEDIQEKFNKIMSAS